MCEGRRAVDLGGQLGRCVFMCIGTRERERERERDVDVVQDLLGDNL